MIGAKGEVYSPAGTWLATVSYRNQHSDRRFVGTHEEPTPNVGINDINVFDLSIGYVLTSRYSLSAQVPILNMDRSLAILDGRVVPRYATQASGIGDSSIMARGWLLDPKNVRQNISLGLGTKIPTGQSDVTNTFPDSTVRTVDQSIQPGDGGWGIIFEASAFKTFGDHFTLFTTIDYLSNPKGTNGVRTFRRRESEAIMSVADQYLARLGAAFPVWSKWNLSGTLAARIEGVPVHDLLGPSEGFRRPGYALSIEPSLVFSLKHNTVSVSVPFAVRRNRKKSVPDEIDDPIVPGPGNGDAAFADYLVLVSYSLRF